MDLERSLFIPPRQKQSMAITDAELVKLLAAAREKPDDPRHLAVSIAFEVSQRVLEELGLGKEVKQRVSEVEAAQLRAVSAFIRTQKEGGVSLDEAVTVLKDHHATGHAVIEDPAAPSRFSPPEIEKMRKNLEGVKTAIEALSKMKPPKTQLSEQFVHESRTLADWRLEQILGGDYARYKKMHTDVQEGLVHIGPRRRE